jgi:glycosyltransferase involved in cell wall biosynthesis
MSVPNDDSLQHGQGGGAWAWLVEDAGLRFGREASGVTKRRSSRPMKLAILGSRGIPPAYGGFETMAWELSRELAARGHEVTVYSHRGRTDETRDLPAGVRRRWVRGLRGKHLETVTHTAMGSLDMVVHRHDAVLLVNAANALFAFLPRLRGTRVALNVDGIERQRAKWGLVGRLWYIVGERLSLHVPNVIVTDAQCIANYYRERYGRETAMIAYGATLLERDPPPDLARHGLPADVEPGRYLLFVSRLEPENQADLVIHAYRHVPDDVPLLIVGDAPYATQYKARLTQLAAADPRVRLVGGKYGDAYTDLQRGAMAYIQATSVGGTHPALIEAMAAGNLVLAFNTPENREVTAGTAILFEDKAQLTEALTRIIRSPASPEHEVLRAAVRARVASTYCWPAVADQYEEVFAGLLPDALQLRRIGKAER